MTDLYAQAEAEWKREHQVDQTVARLDAVVSVEPNHVRALAFSGWLRTSHRPAEFEQGLAQLLRALELNTEDSRVAANVAEALVSAGRGREALEPVQRWCDAHPLEPAGWNTLGWLWGVALGEHAKGLEVLERALSVSPWFANARLNRARVHLALRHLDEAEADLRVALRGDCWRPHEVLVRLGEIAAARGHLRRALGFFRRAVERDTRGDSALSLHQAVQAVGSVLLQQGRYFLHVHEDSLRVQQLEHPATAEAPRPLSELAGRAQQLQGVPALQETCAGLVACAQAQQLLPAFADTSFAQQLEQHGGEVARRLAADWRVAQLALYDELLMREEGAPTPFERALSQRDWSAAKALVLADPDAEQRLTLAERLGDRLALLGDAQQARALWQVAHDAAREFASWATAGGEGLARMADVERLEARLR